MAIVHYPDAVEGRYYWLIRPGTLANRRFVFGKLTTFRATPLGNHVFSVYEPRIGIPTAVDFQPYPSIHSVFNSNGTPQTQVQYMARLSTNISLADSQWDLYEYFPIDPLVPPSIIALPNSPADVFLLYRPGLAAGSPLWPNSGGSFNLWASRTISLDYATGFGALPNSSGVSFGANVPDQVYLNVRWRNEDTSVGSLTSAPTYWCPSVAVIWRGTHSSLQEHYREVYNQTWPYLRV